MIGALIASQITGKSILKYTLLPEVGPRLKNMFDGGFANLAYFMALVYQAVKLLPTNHPYLKSGAIGQYSIRDVLTEASKNVRFDLKHIDQIIVFFALIAGIIILGIQFFLLLIAFLVRPASAQVEMPSGYGDFFTTAAPTEDLAFRLLDSVFGIPGMFNSKEIEGGENAFHTALHGLFQFYSIGLLVIAAMLIIYFIFVVLAETAQTGTPFGKRYNHAWVPIRLVVAIGLLVPVSFGLNSGQWITLHAAKMGSGFATNGWIKFNEVLSEENTLGADSPVAQPNIPELKDLAAFIMIAKACKASYLDKDIKAYLLNSKNIAGIPPKELTATTFYSTAAQYSTSRLIYIRFGEHNDEEYKEHKGNVYPYCGDLTMVVPELLKEGHPGAAPVISPSNKVNGAYFKLIQEMWFNDYEGMEIEVTKYIQSYLTHGDATQLNPNLKNKILKAQKEYVQPIILSAIEQAITEFKDGDQYRDYGWGGAGIFYNDIANINGRMTNAVMNKPQIKKYPSIMEFVCEENKQGNTKAPVDSCYDPKLPKGQRVVFTEEESENKAKALNDVHDYWYKDPDGMTGNGIINVINVMFGTQGLFDMCKNADVHPLAQLSTMGKGLVESAIRNIGIGLGLGLGSLIPVIGPTAGAVSKMAMSFASIGILIGFMLYYLVPFLPFLYFLFAVGGWVKGIFEAMVGVPLWALSHIRIDGQGLPGDGGINGYFLIFEIFIRPILIVFGLIAAVITFGAMIKILNEIFGIVINNLSGNDPTLGDACFQTPEGTEINPEQAAEKQEMANNFRGPIDEFFYTIVYAILVYMIGMASFKLIDLIPNNILRWMGQGLQTFNDQAGEPADGLMSKMAIGGGVMGQQLQSAGSSLGQAGAGFFNAGKGAVSSGPPPSGN
jgi:conjugal transfer/type IV secretion protein DotA/TraY